MNTSDPEQRRLLGVLISVPEPFANEIDRWRRELKDPIAPLVEPHITLLPPLEVTRELFADVATHLADVASRHEPFDVQLKGTDTFRPTTPTAFVQVVQGTAELTTLAADVNGGPLKHTPEFPYHPHVTIAHFVPDAVLDAAQQALAEFEATFTVAEFGLYVPDPDGHWQRTTRFQLSA